MTENTRSDSVAADDSNDDQPDGSGGRFDRCRRDFMRATGAAGLGLPAIANAAAASGDPELPGWLLYHRQKAQDFFENPWNFAYGTCHFINYVDVGWEPFGNPADGEGGCWRHTFLLSGLTGNSSVEGPNLYPDDPDEWEYNPGIDTFEESVVRVDTNLTGVGSDPDSDNVAAAVRRDSSLLGFIDAEGDGEAWNYDDIEVEGYDEGKSFGELIVRSGEYDHRRLTYEDLVTEDETLAQRALEASPNALISLGIMGLSKVFETGGAVVDTITALADIWVDESLDLPPRSFNQSFDVRLGDLDGSVVGHYALFDVYVAPNGSGTVGVHSKNPLQTGSGDFRREAARLRHGFNPCPQIEIDIEGLGSPYENDYDEEELYTATPVRRTTPGSTSSSEFTNVPFRLIGDDDSDPPNAELTCERTELPVPGEPFVLEAAGPDVPTTDRKYLWELVRTGQTGEPEQTIQEWTDVPENSVTLDEQDVYRVVLTVEDPDGKRDSDEFKITVKDRDSRNAALLIDYDPCENPMETEPSDPEPSEDNVYPAGSRWADDEEIPGTSGETLSTNEMQQLIKTWNEQRAAEGEI